LIWMGFLLLIEEYYTHACLPLLLKGHVGAMLLAGVM